MNDYNPMETAAEDLQKVECEIARFGARTWVKLPYPPTIEQRFEQETSGPRRQHLTFYGLLALAIYDLFLVGDYIMYPEHFAVSVAVRLGVVTPIVLVLAWFLQRPRGVALREGGTVLLCVAGCISILFLHNHGDLASTVQAEPGLLMVLLCMNVVLRVEFLYAVAGTVACLLAEALYLHGTSLLTVGNRVTIGGRVGWVATLTLIASYTLAREQRMAWLERLHSRIQGRLLAEVNAELVSLSATDRLTGLNNRYGYELRLDELWKAAMLSGQPVSAVMVDVDHFKNLNDSFGHAYGDRVLSRVASLILQALRAQDDFAARIGGEEFIVLLPDTDERAAVRVAERIRLLVQVAGSPAVGSEAHLTGHERWSTVSCGTATVTPTASSDPQRLIEAADAAMYHAKQTGRNRVCSSPSLDGGTRGISIVTRAS